MNKTQELNDENGKIQLKDLSEITKEEINDQIKIRKSLIEDMVGTLYPQVVNDEIHKLRVMYQYPMDTKVEGGFLYYKFEEEWVMAGKDDHPLTKDFLERAKKKFYESKM